MRTRQINYSAAYSFADYTVSVVEHPSKHGGAEILSDFFEFKTPDFFRRIEKPQQDTILHAFIYEINNFPIQHYLSKIDGEIIVHDYQDLLEGADLPIPHWFNAEQVEDHIDDLRIILERATRIITEAAWQLLFTDRTFLFKFSKFLQPFILQLQPTDHHCIRAPGIVKRSYFPEWLKNAIFFRDRGRCQLCLCDLSNLLVPTSLRHIDHMVPLNAGGTNDPTNFQLTCAACNTAKGAKIYAEKHMTYKFW
jgi:hypothetical protein